MTESPTRATGLLTIGRNELYRDSPAIALSGFAFRGSISRRSCWIGAVEAAVNGDESHGEFQAFAPTAWRAATYPNVIAGPTAAPGPR